MSHALTPRQREYLEFIRQYIQNNESSPRLEEIASHFGVTSPAAHNTLKSLQNNGYLYFGRSKFSGFFIRLIESYGLAETVIEIPIVGKVNKYGEAFEFPSGLGHFATLLLDSEPGELFAVIMVGEIPQEEILAHDVIIFEQGITTRPGDICIAPIGKKQFLIQIDEQIETKFTWHPLAFDKDNPEYFTNLLREQDWQRETIPESFIIATALRLTRRLAF